uniref:Galectin n=1 Tax=Meloidogyne incognita TaxID=6306 RepID=A0A914NJU8_MELIC
MARDIDQIQFGEENEKCKRLLSSFKYPLNIIHVPDNNYLRDGSLIFIEGIIINKTISISFLHQALEWHEFIGQTIFQLNITKENATVGSYSNKQWLPPNCDKISQNKTFDNKCWHKHEFPNLNEGEEFNLNILVRTAKYIWRYKIGGNWYFYEHQMPAQDSSIYNCSNCDKISQNKTFDNKCWHKHEFPNLNEGEEFNLISLSEQQNIFGDIKLVEIGISMNIKCQHKMFNI